MRKRVFTAQVSFGEIFIIKGVGAFEESGYDSDSAMRYVSSPGPPIHSHSRTLVHIKIRVATSARHRIYTEAERRAARTDPFQSGRNASLLVPPSRTISSLVLYAVEPLPPLPPSWPHSTDVRRSRDIARSRPAPWRSPGARPAPSRAAAAGRA